MGHVAVAFAGREDFAGAVTVRFRPSRYIPPQRVGHDLTQRHRDLLQILDGEPIGLAFREAMSLLGSQYTGNQVGNDLNLLRSLNLAISQGRGHSVR